ncbi:MAG: FAD-dependent oxidoreductase [Saprospiraceae bacterium]
MILSFWEKDLLQEKFDVTILGAGITGISTAISLKEKNKNLKICIIERAAVSLGASTKNAGFACFGSPTEILADLKNVGIETTSRIILMRYKGLQKLKQRIPSSKMLYQSCGGYEIYKKDDVSFEKVQDNLSWLNEYLSDLLGLEKVYALQKNKVLPTFHEEWVFNPYEGSLHPGKMMDYLHQLATNLGVVIKRNVHVQKIDVSNNRLLTEDGLVIHYENLCVCTNGFAQSLFPTIPVLAARNQVLITKPLGSIPFSGCFHYDEGYYYFRHYNDRILLGGARNLDLENELTDQFGSTDIIQRALLQFLENICPGASQQVEMWWSGILGIGNDKEPYVQWVKNNIICGVRLGGMGVAIGSHLGDLLADNIILKLERKE